MIRLITLTVLLLAALLVLIAAKPSRPDPGTTASFRREPPGLEAKPIHAIRDRDTGGGQQYLVGNLVSGPIQVRCSLVASGNVRSVPTLPRNMVLPALAEQPVTELHVLDPARDARAAVACDAMVGDPHAHPARGRTYALPFPDGTRYTLD